MKPLARLSFCTLACALVAAPPARAAATFTDLGAGLTGLYEAAAQWGDYDNDGDLDIAVVGQSDGGKIARIYRNTGGVFADAGALPATAAVFSCGLDWGDYDRDGDLDLAIVGFSDAGQISRIYRNTGGTFADIGAGLEGIEGTVAWGDFDNDGDLDLALAGWNGSANVTRVYRNTNGTFADAGAGLTPFRYACLSWCDFDKDGDLDLLTAGANASFADSVQLYRNTAGVLSPVASAFPVLRNAAFAWGDYDNDGDPDLLISGGSDGSQITNLWNNTPPSATFTTDPAVFEGLEYAGAAWGDYDNDGRLDLAIGGTTGSVGYGAVLHNNGPGFSDIVAPVPQMYAANFQWGDYDNDGDLDLLAGGGDYQGVTIPVHRIYRLTGVSANTPPTAPTGLAITVNATTVTFQWNASTDAQTPSLGLTYNLWAGNAAGTPNVVAPMSNLANGFRRVARPGNVGQRLSWTIARSAFTSNSIHWGVQAVDQAYAGSAFATGPLFVVGVDGRPAEAGVTMRLVGPNPARSDTRLAYTLAKSSRVDLAIHDITGRRVGTLVQGEQAAGEHEARWNGERDGAPAAPGVYFARLRADGETVSSRILRIE